MNPRTGSTRVYPTAPPTSSRIEAIADRKYATTGSVARKICAIMPATGSRVALPMPATVIPAKHSPTPPNVIPNANTNSSNSGLAGSC